MGVEMALLRALAFHPKNVIAEIEAPPQVIPQAAVQSAPSAALNMSQRVPPTQVRAENLPDNSPTLQLLKARQALQSPQSEDPSPKKAKPVMPERAKPAASALERLAAVTSKHQQNVENRAAQAAKPQKPKQYQWKPQNEESMAPKEAVTTPSGIKEALEYEKTPELAVKIIEEGRIRDSWSGKIAKLNIPKLVEQLALNSYIEELSDSQIILHLRSAQKHLDKPSAHKVLEEALSEQYGRTVELKIVHDDNSEVKTPLEWRQAIYEEKLAQARQSIIADKTIQKLRSMFDAQLDEESIRPV